SPQRSWRKRLGITSAGRFITTRNRRSDEGVGCFPFFNVMTDRELELKSVRLRRHLLEIIFHTGAGHTGGSLSCLDILNVLYNRVLNVSPQTFSDPNRDRYVQSKGHCVEALYVVLAD